MKKTYNNAEGSQNPEKQPTLAAGKQSNGKSRMKTFLKNVPLLPALIAVMGLLLTEPATAQNFTTVHSFKGKANFSINGDGASPRAGFILSGSTLYGTAFNGGDSGSGTVFKVNTDGSGFTILHTFSALVIDASLSGFYAVYVNSDGANPAAELVLSGNTLYGTTSQGGSPGSGTVFAVNTDGTGFTNLYTFSTPDGGTYGDNGDGAYPQAGLILSGSTLYGTAEIGGASGNGTLFAIQTDGSGFRNLYSFTAGNIYFSGPILVETNSDGATPMAGLILSGHTLYGTALYGGNTGNGTVFAFNLNDSVLTTVHSFTGGNDGASPLAGVILSGNTLYGTAEAGGSSGAGTVFAVNPGGTGFTTLHEFTIPNGASATNTGGAYPEAGLILSGNTLYGTAYKDGASGDGTVFAINTNGLGFRTLHNFTSSPGDGANPAAGLILSGNTLYGAAANGGTNGVGTIFSLNTNALSFTTLYSFTGLSHTLNDSEGANPRAAFVLSGGILYGTASSGGDSGDGTVFAVNTNGSGFTVVHTFTGGDGAIPLGGLILSGNTLYGTASGGGGSGSGTVFKVNTDGSGFTNLYRFTALFGSVNGDGASPNAGLVLSGNTLYGTTAGGGTNGTGTVFAINTNGMGFTTLHTFNFTTDGGDPYAGLILSGNTLYGTARDGGTNGYGTVFAINTNGTSFAVLHTFTTDNYTGKTYVNNDGAHPYASLVLSGSTLYGTTPQGGTNGDGTVFSVNTAGTVFSTVHTFQGNGGEFTGQSGLILSGSTLYGAAFYNSTVFAVSTAGTGFTNLYTLGGSDGDSPLAGLVLSGNTLYGTADVGGSSGNGTVFAVSTTGTGFAVLHSFSSGDEGISPAAGLVSSGNTFYGTTSGGGNFGNGTVFAVNADGTGFSDLYSFTAEISGLNLDGASPVAGLILSGNTLYGTAEHGGTNGYGTVFAINTDGNGFTNLYNFTGGNDGANPIARLVLSGNTLYGTTAGGGTNGNGSIFAIHTDGTGFSNLYSFTALVLNVNADGANPQAGLILSGNTLYGTTKLGGTNGYGTVFAINTDGSSFTNLHSFSGGSDGCFPLAGLILSGNTLYGTTESGGSSAQGNIFALQVNSMRFTNLYSFTNGLDGAMPQAGLILADGILYGTASYGGDSDAGTVFALNPDGSDFTTLHGFTAGGYDRFPNRDGAEPLAGLISSGNTLYGTASHGGDFDVGTVFSLSLSPVARLTLERSGADVIIKWPTNAAGFTLQFTTNLASAAEWSTVSPAPAIISGQNVVTNGISGTRHFYRLMQP
jgi:uncharacterized repeat protein (TIGR03803 family)